MANFMSGMGISTHGMPASIPMPASTSQNLTSKPMRAVPVPVAPNENTYTLITVGDTNAEGSSNKGIKNLVSILPSLPSSLQRSDDQGLDPELIRYHEGFIQLYALSIISVWCLSK